MKKLILIFIVICTHVVAQQKKETKPGASLRLNGKKLNYVFVGKENLYAFKYEISNENYLEYLYDIRKNKGEAEYQRNLPDTTVWRTPLGYLEKFVEHYLRHPAYKDYPVVGVTYEQAENYCNWLTELMNNYYHDKKIKKIRFRLPTEEEWELAARGGLPKGTIFPWGTESICIDKGKFKGENYAQCLSSCSDITIQGLSFLNRVRGFLISRGENTTSVFDYLPNNYGLYNMAGNVAEMVAEKSICKGGAWNKVPHKLVISSRDTFEVAAPWVGFRVFAEIEEYQMPESKLKVDAKFIQDNLRCIPAGGFQVQSYYSIFEPDSAENHKGENTITLSNFYFSQYEVTNEMYLQFLKSITDSVKRKNYTPKDENWKFETALLQYLHYTSQFPKHPVTNIIKEARFSDTYNNDPVRKYEYVEFSLPTAKQQIRVMKADLDYNSYSWGGPYNRNAKGEYLMNFNPLFDFELYDEDKLTRDMAYRKTQFSLLKKSRALDGFELTSPVGTYKASGFGIFNEHGNVAEAVSNSDFVLGGSFASMNGNCSNEIFDGYLNILPELITLPSPQVGFRFVMTGINELRRD